VAGAKMPPLVPAVTRAGRREDHIATIAAPIEAGPNAAAALAAGIAQPGRGSGEVQMQATGRRVHCWGRGQDRAVERGEGGEPIVPVLHVDIEHSGIDWLASWQT